MATVGEQGGQGRLVGKVIFMTGAAQGIGKAVALVGGASCIYNIPILYVYACIYTLY